LAYVARWGATGIAMLVAVTAGLLFRRFFIPFVREFDGPAGERGVTAERHDGGPS
jgi:hypothetical protein